MMSEALSIKIGIRGNRVGRSNVTAVNKEIGDEINDHLSVQCQRQDHSAQVLGDQRRARIQHGQDMHRRSQRFILRIVDKTDHEHQSRHHVATLEKYRFRGSMAIRSP